MVIKKAIAVKVAKGVVKKAVVVGVIVADGLQYCAAVSMLLNQLGKRIKRYKNLIDKEDL